MLSGLTAIVAIPLLFTTTYRLVQPHLAMQRLIAAQRTPFVLIDDDQTASPDHDWADSALDHVRNMPDLSNRPLRFSSADLTPRLLVALCQRGEVTLVTVADMHRVGFIENVPVQRPKFDALVGGAVRQAPHCFRPAMVPGPPVRASVGLQ